MPAQAKDAEADELIGQGVTENPQAAYLLVQTVPIRACFPARRRDSCVAPRRSRSASPVDSRERAGRDTGDDLTVADDASDHDVSDASDQDFDTDSDDGFDGSDTDLT